MVDCIIMDLKDNVATVIHKTVAGDHMTIADTKMNEVGTVVAVDEIPFAHKISLTDIRQGDKIVKYGQLIGKATMDIPLGGYAHVHNIVSIEGSEKVVSVNQDKGEV